MGLTRTQLANQALYNLGGRALTNIDTDTIQQAVVIRSYIDTARDEMLRCHPWNFATKRTRIKTDYIPLTGAVISNSSGEISINFNNHGLINGSRILISDVNGLSINTDWFVTVLDVNNFILDDSVYATGYVANSGTFVTIPQFKWNFQFPLPTDSLRIISLENAEDNFAVENGMILANSDTISLKYIYQATDTTLWPNDFCNVFAMLLTSYIAQSLDGPAGEGVNYRKMYEQMLKPIIKFTDSNEGRQKFIDLDQQSEIIMARKGFYNY
jgi:hypothetical protein